MGLYAAIIGEEIMQSTEQKSEIAGAEFVEQESNAYSKFLKEEQTVLHGLAVNAKQASEAGMTALARYLQDEYTQDSQEFQTYNNITQNFLSSLESSESRLGDSVSQLGNMFKGLMQNFWDYTNNLIAQG